MTNQVEVVFCIKGQAAWLPGAPLDPGSGALSQVTSMPCRALRSRERPAFGLELVLLEI